MGETFDKDPSAKLDYTVDWSSWLCAGETITASDWTVPDGLTEASASFDDDSATVWLTGGTDDTDYKVVNQITTNAGRIDQRTIVIAVKER